MAKRKDAEPATSDDPWSALFREVADQESGSDEPLMAPAPYRYANLIKSAGGR